MSDPAERVIAALRRHFGPYASPAKLQAAALDVIEAARQSDQNLSELIKRAHHGVPETTADTAILLHDLVNALERGGTSAEPDV